MPKARLTPINEDEKQWLAAQLVHAQRLTGQPAEAAQATPPSLAALDQVWVAGSAHLRASNSDPNPFILVLGAAFGQWLVDRLHLKWVVATDEAGTDLAVHGKVGDVLVYPMNLVAKRWEQGLGEPFLEALFNRMEADISRIQKGLPPR